MKIKSIVALFAVIMIIGVGAISQASPVFAESSGDTKAEITYVQQIDNINVGETTNIKVTVKNTGTTTFDSNVYAKLYVNGDLICTTGLDGLKTGQERTVELEYTPSAAGTYEYKSKVKHHVDGSIITLAQSSTYSFVAESGDTKAEITYVQQIDNINVGETTNIKVTVKNTGTTTFDSNVYAKLYVNGDLICTTGLDGLKTGQERTVELEYTPSAAGTYEYKSKVKHHVDGSVITLAQSSTYSFVAEEGNEFYHRSTSVSGSDSDKGGSGGGGSNGYIEGNNIKLDSRATIWGTHWATGTVWDLFTYDSENHRNKIKVSYNIIGTMNAVATPPAGGSSVGIEIYLRIYDVTDQEEVENKLIYSKTGNSPYFNEQIKTIQEGYTYADLIKGHTYRVELTAKVSSSAYAAGIAIADFGGCVGPGGCKICAVIWYYDEVKWT